MAETLNTNENGNCANRVLAAGWFDEEMQNECWFQIVNTVEDMSNEPTWDEVIKMLKLNYMVVPRNYR